MNLLKIYARKMRLVYENTDYTDIEKIYAHTWLNMELYFLYLYLRFSSEWNRSIANLMSELREKEYHAKLRAGQSMRDLILSRSEKHGLRSNQARVSFSPYSDAVLKISFVNSVELIQISQNEIKVTGEIEELLNKLVKEPIT